MSDIQTSVSRSASSQATPVLIVDDEENFLVLLDRILTKEGYEVSTALNSQQAWDLIEEGAFQLAILDIKMFPIDGIGLLSEIRKRSPSTRVIMITAYPTHDGRNECMRRGADVYLTKPLDLRELKNIMRHLVPN